MPLELVPGEITARSPLQLFWRRFRSDRVAMASLVFIVVLILVAIVAPLIVKPGRRPRPNAQNVNALDAFGQPTGPSSAHPFGVDELGRDVFARVIYGARVSLEVAFIATGVAVLIGVVVGTDRRLLPRLGRHAALAPDGHRAGVPDPAARRSASPRRARSARAAWVALITAGAR